MDPFCGLVDPGVSSRWWIPSWIPLVDPVVVPFDGFPLVDPSGPLLDTSTYNVVDSSYGSLWIQVMDTFGGSRWWIVLLGPCGGSRWWIPAMDTLVVQVIRSTNLWDLSIIYTKGIHQRDPPDGIQ
jgi:hypothetical protein